MDGLISIQSVIDLLKQMRKDGNMIPWEGKDVFEAIRKLPSNPDAVHVVRCYECECWEPENVEEGDTSGRCRMDGPCEDQLTDMTWFCADGVKKDG